MTQRSRVELPEAWDKKGMSISNNKTATVSNALTERPERLSLAKERDMMYEKLRTNLRILRAGVDISAVELSKQLGLKSGHRILDIEYGRGTPTMEELIILSKYYKVSIDDLLNKKAVITFEI